MTSSSSDLFLGPVFEGRQFYELHKMYQSFCLTPINIIAYFGG